MGSSLRAPWGRRAGFQGCGRNTDLHEESLGFGSDPACHSGLPHYTLSSRTETWEGAESVPSPLGRRWSQRALLHSALFMHHILPSAGEETPPPPGWASGTELLGVVGCWDPTYHPGASCLTHSRLQGDLWPSLHGAPPTRRGPPNKTHRPVCPGSLNCPPLRTRKDRQQAHRTWADEAPSSQWGLGNWERGELPPSSGLFLPYLVLLLSHFSRVRLCATP